MATLTKVQRTRLAMDVIKDGEVASLANYANVELIDPATAIKYARAFWDAYPQPELTDAAGDPREPTNAELAANYLNRLRQYHAAVLRSVRVKAAAEAARDAEQTTVDGEITADIGDEESL